MPEVALEAVEQIPAPSNREEAGKDAPEETSPVATQWDGEKNKFVSSARDETSGRFAKVRESLAQSEQKSRYVKAVLEGTVQPTEEMLVDTWMAARRAQIRAQADKITPPDFGSADGSQTAETPAAEFPDRKSVV